MKLKKCTFCGEWTNVTGSPDDKCEHCGELVNIEIKERQEKRQKVSDTEPQLFYMVQPTDSFLVKIIRRIAGGIYFVIMGIVSFIVWLVALLPG